MNKSDQKKKLFVLELNEFNLHLMKELAEAHDFQNLKKILSFNQGVTLTDDEYDSGYLEPWVQWVNIHTGVSSSEHKIKHLGDVPNLNFKQIWEKLSEQGLSTIVWGAMNASRGNAKNCKYFLPDPWTYSEPGYPKQAAQLLELPRYLAKNYLNVNFFTTIKKLFTFIRAFDFSIFFSKEGFLELCHFYCGLFQYGFKNFIFIGYFDFISVQIFLKLRKKLDPDASFIFLNSLAHIQHHYWEDGKKNNLIFGYGVIDRAVGLILQDLKENDEMIVINALSQKNTNDEKPWVLYRQKDPKNFFLSLCLNITNVEQLMTHDSHLHFNSAADRDRALSVLSKTTIKGSKLFFCEKNPADEKSLFIRLDFYDDMKDNSLVEINGVKFNFFDEFKAIVTRTGKHVQKGDILLRQAQPPTKIHNHHLYNYIAELVR